MRPFLTISNPGTSFCSMKAVVSARSNSGVAYGSGNTDVPRWPSDMPVLVIDTETRHLPAGRAAALVRAVAAGYREFAPWLIYKKTVSTLRGNIAAEFGALLDVFSERTLVYAPAYPQMGRTVVA